MNNDRTDEYSLVVEVRKYSGHVNKKISDATKRDYEKKYERMKRTGKTPESMDCKKSYYSYRAAILYCISQEAATALKLRDKSRFRSTEWQAAMQVLKRCKAVFDRYPPDPERIHRTSGSPSFTWADVRTKKFESNGNLSTTVKSKKRVLSKLRKIDDWHSKLFSQVTTIHKNAAAICSLTGARPSEIARGVIVRIAGESSDPHLIIMIRGTKLTDASGQPERVLRLKTNSPEAAHLLQQCQDGNFLTVGTHPANLTAAIIKAGRIAFPNLRMTVSPYVLRHSISAELKASGIDEEEIAKTLGHQATKSQQAYGHQAQASGSHNILAVAAKKAIRLTHRHPQEVLRVPTHTPSVRFRPD